MTGFTPWSEIVHKGYRRWYQFGLRSPEVLYRRLRNKFRPTFYIRRWYQRARYGIADSDAWGLDYFLAMTTVRGVQKLREWSHGYPSELTPEAWDAILKEIEDGFQLWLDRDGWFEGHKEQLRFDRAMQLYGQWFSALWD